MGNLLRASVALALVTAIVAFLGAPVVAVPLARVSLAERAAEATAVADPSRAFAAPAVVQGVVLFTLFAVFLI